MRNRFIPGATALGLIYDGGVIVAAEKRLTYGSYIATKKVKKVFKMTDHVGAACAGLIADMQEIIREVAAIIKLKEIRSKVPARANNVAKLTSVLLYQNKMYPYITQILIGGYVEKPELYSLDPLGSLISDKYIALGTGAEIAMGVLESTYKDAMPLEEAKKLVIHSMKSAIGRDAASGDGIDMLIFREEGVEEESYSF
ncbi:MAG: proteasome subunit beta [Nitrososphaeria archaeon]|nr:proteasome subunit beta [Nitrososphaeria archaeon]